MKSFVEGHGGVVRVASEMARGSRFTMILPMMPSTQAAVNITPGDGAAGSGRRPLLIRSR